MTDEGQIWATVPEFPEYSVSNYGLVWSEKRRRVLKPVPNQYGNLRVGFYSPDGHHQRSVALLVAEAFVPKEDFLSDSVVLLDGRRSNVAADNIVWRPRWFAWKYARQMHSPIKQHFTNLRVANLDTGVEYASIKDAAQAEGLLFEDIWASTHRGTGCYPGNSTWEVTERV